MHNHNAGVLRFPGTFKLHLAPLIPNSTAVLAVDSRQYLHEGGFSGAILTHQCMDLALFKFQTGIF